MYCMSVSSLFNSILLQASLKKFIHAFSVQLLIIPHCSATFSVRPLYWTSERRVDLTQRHRSPGGSSRGRPITLHHSRFPFKELASLPGPSCSTWTPHRTTEEAPALVRSTVGHNLPLCSTSTGTERGRDPLAPVYWTVAPRVENVGCQRLKDAFCGANGFDWVSVDAKWRFRCLIEVRNRHVGPDKWRIRGGVCFWVPMGQFRPLLHLHFQLVDFGGLSPAWRHNKMRTWLYDLCPLPDLVPSITHVNLGRNRLRRQRNNCRFTGHPLKFRPIFTRRFSHNLQRWSCFTRFFP